jgi:hypothetical protein
MGSSEKSNADLTIYIPLRNEGVEVFRPTEAMAFGGGYFKVLPTPHYDPTDEEWQFIPETIVRGEWRKNGSDEYLYAVERLVLSPEEIEWLSFVDEGEYELWGIRKHLEDPNTREAFVQLIKKHLIQIKKDGMMFNEAEATRVIESPLTSPRPALELVITPSGRLIYFQDPQVKRYFQEKSKKGS